MASSRKTEPADLYGRVRDVLRVRIAPGARLCLGFSGGLDSSVLLHVLAVLRQELDFRLTAVHVHHGLSAAADTWAAFCRAVCSALDVPLDVHPVRVERTGQGLEAAARAARYRIYAAEAADFIVLAHHCDDQVETLFLHLLRGAGVRGLAAMPEERPLGAGLPRLLRPLLGIERDVLRRHAEVEGIRHVDDPSNLDTNLTRNWLRQAWLPELAARFPSYRRQVARSATSLGECACLLEDLARLDFERASRAGALDLAVLGDLGSARAKNLLRYWLAGRVGKAPTSGQLEELLAQMLTADNDAQPQWRWAGLRLTRFRGELRLATDAPPPALAATVWTWRGEAELRLGEHGRLRLTATQGQGVAAAMLVDARVEVRWRQGGERLQPDCRRPRRQLKKLLQERGLPPEARGRLPLLYSDERLIWVAGIGADCVSQARADEPGWLISWYPAG